jgi:hypothetical protein
VEQIVFNFRINAELYESKTFVTNPGFNYSMKFVWFELLEMGLIVGDK